MTIIFNDEKQKLELEDLRKEEEESLVKILSDKYNLPYIDLRGIAPEPDAMLLLKEEESRGAGVAAFKTVGKKLYIATLSPENEKLESIVKPLEEQHYEILLFMCSHASLQHVYSRYADLHAGQKVENGMLELTPEKMTTLMSRFSNVEQLTNVFDELTKSAILYKTTRIIELIMAGALKFNASDIHIEPEEKKVRVRYRLNGILEDIAFIDFNDLKNITSRFKLLSGLKLSTSANAQDGRFSINLGEAEVDIRVSIIPGNYGENFVMRLLDPRNAVTDLSKIAFPKKLRETIDYALGKPNGVILTTGPTGSGKTTTLYAFLHTTYSEEIKIITIEDPIEYHLEGITQTQVDIKKGYTFVSGLRAALRQDPDVIMVGEIRDEDTAKVAINAALTGHLVFSTLHTNTAAGTIPRLIDLGVNAKVIASALSLAIAQRLVRKLCNECKAVYETNEKESRVITNILGDMKISKKEESMLSHVPKTNYTIFHAVGCEHCGGTGYSGRIGIFEAVVMNSAIETILITNPSEREIVNASKNQGIPSLREDAILKVLEGLTSFEEVSRAVDLYAEL
ncbi:MAG: Flp pilus assembly complex ATPase component TadA [Candidatus Pacebacteria bacterium]|nr:Flp pilus assembly complex ATPase component TadA [Candidatus Paceibacterota bacterium]MBP9866701.1 Flp pilus assembly complex ATPase component TadA [Candidatus Paceibacterota bacterium]